MTDAAATRRVGATDLHTIPLVLGGNVFGWTIDKATGFRLLDRFVDQGGTMIDTADVYSAWVDGNSGGESETIIGEWLKTSGKRDAVTLMSKVGLWHSLGGGRLEPERIASACDASLQRLGTDRLDVYFAHRDDPDTSQEAYVAAFAGLVEAGKVDVLGASNFGAMRLKSAIDIAKAAGLPHFQILQPEYNLVNRHDYEGEKQDYCVEYNVAVVPYYALAAGFLTGKYREANDMAKSARAGGMADLIEGRGKPILAALDQVADETGATLPQIALAWLAAQPGVTAPIASATSIEQVDELLGSTRITLSADQLDRLAMAGA